MRFYPSGDLEVVQQPDVANKIAHIWITSNREVFGLDDFKCDEEGVVLEIPVKQLLAVLRACENQDQLNFELCIGPDERTTKLIISTEAEFFSFASTVHEVPVVRLQLSHAESYFREPLISKPSITFIFPAIPMIHGKLSRLAKFSSSITLSANYDGKFICASSGTYLRAQIEHKAVQVINNVENINDTALIHPIQLALESVVKVLSCCTALQTQVVGAIVPKESMIFSTKIPNPCGPDRPAGSMSIILAAYDEN